MESEVIAAHMKNAEVPIEVTPSGITIEVREEHS